MPKYGNSAPGSQNGIFQKNSFFWKGLQISLPTSPQPPSDIKFKSSYARKRDYAQIWKFGPRPPENDFFRKFLILMERSLNFGSNKPSTTPDIKFKSSYARKLDFSLLCPNMEIQPQAPKNGIFQKKFIFLKRSPDFASNEPSTTPRH